MTRRKAGLQRERLWYEYGFRSPAGDEVTCQSLEEARFYAERGAVLLVRERELRSSPWSDLVAP